MRDVRISVSVSAEEMAELKRYADGLGGQVPAIVRQTVLQAARGKLLPAGSPAPRATFGIVERPPLTPEEQAAEEEAQFMKAHEGVRFKTLAGMLVALTTYGDTVKLKTGYTWITSKQEALATTLWHAFEGPALRETYQDWWFATDRRRMGREITSRQFEEMKDEKAAELKQHFMERIQANKRSTR